MRHIIRTVTIARTTPYDLLARRIAGLKGLDMNYIAHFNIPKDLSSDFSVFNVVNNIFFGRLISFDYQSTAIHAIEIW